MAHVVRESGRAIPMTANSTVVLGGNHLYGFLAKVSGTITVTLKNGNTGTIVSEVVVDAVPVTAGVYTPIPITFPSSPEGCTVTLGGGATGTLIA